MFEVIYTEKEDIFEKALRLLYERRLEQLGVTANIIIMREVNAKEKG